MPPYDFHEEDDRPSALDRAKATWNNGQEISIDLAAELMAEGYIIPVLERRYNH